MNTIIPLHQVDDDTEKFCGRARAQKLFIYPTDTVYGLGGIVTETVIQAITTIKQRPQTKHYSIIAPSFTRIDRHCSISLPSKQLRHTLQQQFPGRGLTSILPINPLSGFPFHLLTPTKHIGVRILPNHPMQRHITHVGEPFITTSCNRSGQQAIHDPATAHTTFHDEDIIIIDGGVCDNPPSVIVEYSSGKVIRA